MPSQNSHHKTVIIGGGSAGISLDYTMKPHPAIPLIDTKKERYDMWLLKRYGLPFMYWNLMLRGRA